LTGVARLKRDPVHSYAVRITLNFNDPSSTGFAGNGTVEDWSGAMISYSEGAAGFGVDRSTVILVSGFAVWWALVAVMALFG
jgi:hypothetical protein